MEYYRQLRVKKIQAAELSAQLAQAQLSALKMQVHPHFLFNTLNSIAALLHKDVELADKMIARLSDFLRMTLNSSNTSVTTLGQELEFLKTYLEIEKTRFQERLIIEINADHDTLEAHVPNLILQPLVENAVRHGVAKRKTIGRLEVTAARAGDRLVMTVKDNGPGLNGKNVKKTGSGGLGLANTRARLEQFYENDFKFEIANEAQGNGAVVNIDVPFID
jgi:two-component system LytT family sensor kinase